MSNFQQANDFLMTEGGKSFPFNEIGDKVTGEVVSAEVRQQTDLDTGEKLTWSDGQPRMQMVVELQTALRDGGDNDDGIRTIYAKGGKFDVGSGTGQAMKNAIATAVREGGGTGLNPGDQLVVAWTGEGVKKNRGFNAPKLYTASYRKAAPPSVSGADLFDD
jgi:hypothetical protein